MLMHGGRMHLFGSMLNFWIFGGNIEHDCGRVELQRKMFLWRSSDWHPLQPKGLLNLPSIHGKLISLIRGGA